MKADFIYKNGLTVKGQVPYPPPKQWLVHAQTPFIERFSGTTGTTYGQKVHQFELVKELRIRKGLEDFHVCFVYQEV